MSLSLPGNFVIFPRLGEPPYHITDKPEKEEENHSRKLEGSGGEGTLKSREDKRAPSKRAPCSLTTFGPFGWLVLPDHLTLPLPCLLAATPLLVRR